MNTNAAKSLTRLLNAKDIVCTFNMVTGRIKLSDDIYIQCLREEYQLYTTITGKPSMYYASLSQLDILDSLNQLLIQNTIGNG